MLDLRLMVRIGIVVAEELPKSRFNYPEAGPRSRNLRCSLLHKRLLRHPRWWKSSIPLASCALPRHLSKTLSDHATWTFIAASELSKLITHAGIWAVSQLANQGFSTSH